MNEKIKAVLRKIAADPELVARLNACQNPDEAYKLASSLQDGFTQEEFVSAMKDLDAAVKADDLSDADLEKIAGGGTSELVLSFGVSVVGSASAAAAAAI